MPIDAELLKTISTGFEATFQETYNSTSMELEELATLVPSDDLQETYPFLGNLPNMRKWVGARQHQELTSHKFTIVNDSYEATVPVPAKYIKYDKAKLFASQIKTMAQNAKKFPNQLIADLINSGKTNLCYDGKPFFATDHEMGSATYSNVSTLALNATNLGAAFDFMSAIENESGEAMGIQPNLLLVGPKNRANAKKLVGLDQNGTNENFELVDYKVTPALKGFEWCLLDTTKAVKPFILQIAEDASFEEDTGLLFSEDKMVYGTKAFWNAGYALWQLAWFSDGTGA